MPTIPQISVPRALAGPVTDEILEHTIAIARDAQDGKLDEASGQLLLLVAAPIMEECLQWRRRMAVIRDVASADNVILMPGAA